MLGLLLLGILIVFIFSGWIGMRKVASLPPHWRGLAIAPLLCFILFAVLELSTGYTLASPWGPLLIFGLACASYLFLSFLMWHWSRLLAVAALVLPAGVLLADLVGGVVALLMWLGSISAIPTVEGRISPRACYRVVRYPGVWAGATSPYTYEIYANPPGLTVVWKKVASGTLPCGAGDDASNFEIRSGTNDRSVVIACRKPQTDFTSREIPIG